MSTQRKKPWYRNVGVISVIVAVVGVLVPLIIFLLESDHLPDFSLSIDPIEISVKQGGEVSGIINVSGMHKYKHPIYLSASGHPSELVFIFSPQSGHANPAYISTLTTKVGSNIQPGKYTIAIKGIGADGKEHTCNYILNVTPVPHFNRVDMTELFFPSGFMGETNNIRLDYEYGKTPKSGNNCIRIQYYSPQSRPYWAGIYWQYPNNNWGDSPEFRDLKGASRITFWARGEKGGEKAEFKVGGIRGRYSDSIKFAISTDVIELPNVWEKYEIDLNGSDLTHIIGGFCWVTSAKLNPVGCIIYLDDIFYE